MKRPTGVTVLAVLAFVTGGLHFLAAFLAFGAGSWISAEARSGYYLPGVAPYADAFGSLGFWIGLVGMVTAAFTLAAACGLWILARWGYRLSFVVLGLNLLLDVVNWWNGLASFATVLGALVAIVAIVYLRRPQVRHAFDGFPIDAPVQQLS